MYKNKNQIIAERILTKNAKEIIKRLEYLSMNKQVDQFIREVELLKTKINLHEFQDQTKYPIQSMYLKMKEMLDRFVLEYEKIEKKQQNWNVKQLQNDSFIAVRITGSIIQVKYQAVLPTNIENMCIMIYLTKLYSQWVPFCKESLDIEKISALEKIAFLKFSFPLLADRCAFIHGIAMDRIQENGTMVICGEGITKNKQKLDKIKQNGVNVQKMMQKKQIMDIKYFICEIYHLKGKQFIFKMYAQVNNQMSILPEWIVNSIVKQVGGYMIENIVKRSTDLRGTLWQKEIQGDEKENNKFYQWLHQRIENWKEQTKLKQSKL